MLKYRRVVGIQQILTLDLYKQKQEFWNTLVFVIGSLNPLRPGMYVEPEPEPEPPEPHHFARSWSRSHKRSHLEPPWATRSQSHKRIQWLHTPDKTLLSTSVAKEREIIDVSHYLCHFATYIVDNNSKTDTLVSEVNRVFFSWHSLKLPNKPPYGWVVPQHLSVCPRSSVVVGLVTTRR